MYCALLSHKWAGQGGTRGAGDRAGQGGTRGAGDRAGQSRAERGIVFTSYNHIICIYVFTYYCQQ